MSRIQKENNKESLVYKAFIKEVEEPTFVCKPEDDPIKIATEASNYAKEFSKTVNFVYEGMTQKIGPNDILFQKRPEIVKAGLNLNLTPADYGRQAFQKGIKSVPVLDKEFMQALREKWSSNVLQALTEWTKGWHSENMKPPKTESQPPV